MYSTIYIYTYWNNLTKTWNRYLLCLCWIYYWSYWVDCYPDHF